MRAALLASVLLSLASCDRFRQRCERNGGHVVEFNCHDETEVMLLPCGDGNMVCPMTTTHTECDRRCDGARPEAGK